MTIKERQKAIREGLAACVENCSGMSQARCNQYQVDHEDNGDACHYCSADQQIAFLSDNGVVLKIPITLDKPVCNSCTCFTPGAYLIDTLGLAATAPLTGE
ncbi:hypothetical protein LCGC14_1432650 [marine sediment metagenome]|uniref:Uncharacterized protein n=1 Tax=marine sediment metagenome TaxID=412755 RepID=A0A0F9M3K2_9ZZZZ